MARQRAWAREKMKTDDGESRHSFWSVPVRSWVPIHPPLTVTSEPSARVNGADSAGGRAESRSYAARFPVIGLFAGGGEILR